MKTQGTFTITYIPEDGEEPIPPCVIEFDHFDITMDRPVYHEKDMAGNTVRLIPGRITTTVITGIQNRLSKEDFRAQADQAVPSRVE